MNEPNGAGSPLAQPVMLSGLLSVQEGSVVSRTVIKKSAGTVTIFAFDAGEGLSEHSTPHDALVQGLEGRIEITIAGEPHEVHAGEVLLLPSTVPHGLRAATPAKMLLTMIRDPAG